MPRTIKLAADAVKQDGETFEVTLPEGTLTADEVSNQYVAKDQVNTIVKTRLAEATEGLAKPADLLTDEKFRTEALKSWGIKPNAKGIDEAELATKVQAAVAEREAIWNREKLEPLVSKAEQLQNRVGTLMQSKLHGDILAAASEAGVKKALLKPGPNGVPRIINEVAPYFDYHEKSDSFAVVEQRTDQGVQFKIGTEAKQDRPYMDARDFFKNVFAKDPDNKDFLDDTRQPGPGLGEPGGTVSGGVMKLTREQASDHRTYQQAQEQAAKAGLAVVVED